MDLVIKNLPFGEMIRDLRLQARLKQREVAEVLGLKVASYGNAESAPHKRFSEDRVHALARLYKLDFAATETLLAAWRALPASDYAATRNAEYAAANTQRSKARAHDRLRAALVDVVSLLVAVAPDPDSLCSCRTQESQGGDDFGAAASCEVCSALQALGVPAGWTNKEQVISQLAAMIPVHEGYRK